MEQATILVVEDETIVAKDIQYSLQRLGYHVPSTATSGEEAIRKAGELKPDLVSRPGRPTILRNWSIAKNCWRCCASGCSVKRRR